MKITAEFNSNAELVNFISTFGGKISGPVTEVKVDRYEKAAPNASAVVIKKVETPAQVKVAEIVDKAPKQIKEADISKEIETKDAEIVKTDEKKGEDPKVTKEMVRAVFTKLFKEGKQKIAKELTAKFGANNLSELKETDYATIYKEAGGLI